MSTITTTLQSLRRSTSGSNSESQSQLRDHHGIRSTDPQSHCPSIRRWCCAHSSNKGRDGITTYDSWVILRSITTSVGTTQMHLPRHDIWRSPNIHHPRTRSPINQHEWVHAIPRMPNQWLEGQQTERDPPENQRSQNQHRGHPRLKPRNQSKARRNQEIRSPNTRFCTHNIRCQFSGTQISRSAPQRTHQQTNQVQ